MNHVALEVDACQVERLADRDPEAAVELLRGGFLEGLSLEDAPSFEDWLTAERRRYRSIAVSILFRLGDEALAANDFARAQAVAQRALDLDPFSESAASLQLRALSVASARPLENDHDAPWSTLRILLEAGLAGMPGLACASPRAISVLAALSPQLAERVEPTVPRDTSDVAKALESALSAISEEQPVGILIDDAHLADGSSLGALAGAAANLGKARVVVVLTADTTAEDVPKELVRLQSDLGRRIPGETVFLKPFSEKEMRALVGALATWCDSEEMVDRLSRRLVLEAGGTPFFAVTLLRDLDRTSTLKHDLLMWPRPAATMDSPLPFSVPDLARLAIVGRVGNLDEESKQVLRAASIGSGRGRGLDIELISELVGHRHPE